MRLGLADGIVDLVESGENHARLWPPQHLQPPQLPSCPHQILYPHPRSNTELIDLITARIRGVIAASKYVLCQYNVQKKDLESALAITPVAAPPPSAPRRERLERR